MEDPTPNSPPSPFASILTWSASRPEWQRDALRRIVESGPLGADAMKELSAICRAKHGLLPDSDTAPTAVPLDASHTRGGADGTASVSLSKISSLQSVGRIPSDQVIEFGTAPGLTVIYGENGAGKSGYALVIKKACRARGKTKEIKPDVFAAGTAGPAKATIICRVGTDETSVEWTAGSPTDPRLGNIFVFDSSSAEAHVGDDDSACFKPRGLDVLPELAKACDAIKAELQPEIEAAFDQIRVARDTWNPKGTTAVGKVVYALDADTDPVVIDAAAMFTDIDESRLAELAATLSADPRIKAADTTAAAVRIRKFAEIATSRALSVDDTNMQGLADAMKDANISAKAAEAAAELEATGGDLPGSGNDVWRKLWDAAKAYSIAHAYPGRPFPVTAGDAKCVLCQQVLQIEAIDRYGRFSRFVADEVRKQADDAKAKVAAMKLGVDLLRAIGTDAPGIKADLDRESPGKGAAAEAFAKGVDARIAHAQQCLKDGTWSDAPLLPASPCADLLTLAATLDVRATAEAATVDPVKKKEAETERDELTDKKWLSEKAGEVKAQISRYAHAAKLKKCQDDCTTNTITRKVGELEEAHVNQAFRDAFKNEILALGMKSLPVKLDAARPIPGQRRHGVRVEGVPVKPNGDPVHRVEDIASEGEHRCIALAAFMAELSQASHKSAVVFDDPVSSLDHRRRDAIAARLVSEAAHRQVVIFTHDLALVCDLQSAAHASQTDIHYQHVEWFADRPGRVLPGLMWDAKSYDAQMKTLREQVGKAAKVHRDQGETEYREVMMPVVSRVRGACERIIEQYLLNGVIKRHDSRIDVRNTPSLAAVTADQWKAVHAIWKDCSNIIEAHAPPQSGPRNIPDPIKLNLWVTDLANIVEEVKAARQPNAGKISAQSPPTAMRTTET